MISRNHSDDRLDAMYRAWAEHERANAETVDLVHDLPHRVSSRRWVVSMAAALLIVAVVVGVMVLRGTSNHSPTASGVTHASDQMVVASGRAHDYVLHEGDTATGTGEVLALPGRPVRFCAPYAVADVGGRGDPAFTYCAVGLDVRGVNLNHLADRHAHNGAVYGYAHLTGVYTTGLLTVSAQRPATLKPMTVPGNPPCPTPASGWGAGQPSMNAAENYQRAHRGSIVMLAYLNPTPHQSLVYVLAAGDPGPIREALASTYGKKLCVARSRYTIAQVATARRLMQSTILSNHRQTLTALSEAGGLGLGPDEQPVTPASVPILSAQLARTIDTQPPGLVQLTVWLAPTH